MFWDLPIWAYKLEIDLEQAPISFWHTCPLFDLFELKLVCYPKGEEMWQQHKVELLGVSLTEAGHGRNPFEAFEVSFAFKSWPANLFTSFWAQNSQNQNA